MLRLLSLCVILFASTAGAAERPNVLLIMADDYCTALDSYGREQCRTPNLDRLARQGVSFDNAFCQFSLCGPSRSSMICGMYPSATGVTTNWVKFRDRLPDHVTLPQLFSRHGYWAGRVGKILHMTTRDHLEGWPGNDDAESWDLAVNLQGPEWTTLGKREVLSPRIKIFGQQFLRIEAEGDDLSQVDGKAASAAIELLEARADDEKPFFLAVGFFRPHVPLVAPKKYFEPFPSDEMKLPPQIPNDLDDLPAAALTQTNKVKYGMNERQARGAISSYYAAVAYMDAQAGRVLDALDELGLRDNTIVVFTSDHGYHLGEHTMWQKLSTFEEGSRVPLIVSAPGQQARNQRSSQIVELVDLYPTLAELAGLPTPEVIQGASFGKLLDDPSAERTKQDAYLRSHNSEALRTPHYKYIEFREQGEEGEVGAGEMTPVLFDLDRDPHEYTNLAGDPAYAEAQSTLRARLDAIRRQAKQPGVRE